MRRIFLICLLWKAIATISRGSQSPLSCNPILCNDQNAKTHLAIIARGDGVGATIQQIVYAAAYALKRGWNFGGITEPNDSHGVMKDLIMEYLFGNYENVLTKYKLRDVKAPHVKISDIKALQTLKPDDTMVIDYQNGKFDLDSLGHLDDYLTPRYLQILRCSAYCHITSTMRKHSHFSSNTSTLKVVAHIRRGDVLLNDTSRITTDDIYFRLFRAIHHIAPHAELHAFTSTLQMSSIYIDMIARYAAHNITLHVDSEESSTFQNDFDGTNAIKVAWAHFITADILLTSKSSFSTVPALFNSNCVLYQKFWHLPLSQWIVLPISKDGIPSRKKQHWNRIFTQQLPRCIRRLSTTRELSSLPSYCKICAPDL